MSVTINKSSSHLELRFGGKLNIYMATECMDEIKKHLQVDIPVHIDLSEVEEIDAAGLQILLTLKLHCMSHGLTFLVISQSEAVIEMLELSDTTDFFGELVVLTDI